LVRGAASLLDRPDQNWLYAIGRLRGDVGPAAIAAAATRALQSWLGTQPVITDRNRSDLPRQTIVVAPASGGVALMRIAFSASLTVLSLTSGLVLLIACANLANLLLARADRGQAAIRAALGASSARLMRQAMTEGLVLALAGGLLGFLIASAGTRALIALAFPGASYVPMDDSPPLLVVLFGLALALVTGAVFSAAPAWAMARTNPLNALQGVGRSGGERSFVPRRSLVVVQVALSLVLVAGAGLLGRSLANLEEQPLGFVAEDRTIVRVELPAIAGEIDRLGALYDRLQQKLRQIPGVVNASYVLYSPMESNNYQMQISIDGRPSDPAQPDSSPWNRVGPRYFDTTGTRVLHGRAIDERDTPGAARVAVVNRAFVRRYFENAIPLGRRLGLGDASHATDFEIVGVVEDVKYSGANQPVRPMIFFPTLQTVEFPAGFARTTQTRSTLARAFVVHTSAGSRNLEPELRRAIAEIDPDITVIRVVPLVDQVLANFRLDRLKARLLTAYGALALVLAALGLYGVTAYSVARRRREIGIRMALGAGRRRILGTVLRGPLSQTVAGIAIGLPLALFATRAVESDLFGVSARNPLVLATAVLVLLASAATAAIVPALRATAVDPTQALR
jgi:predicted permease